MLGTEHKNIQILKGLSPILISAPHTTPIRKIGENGMFYIKPKEIGVNDLVKNLCKKTGAWGILTTSEIKPTIENWDEEIYKTYCKIVKTIIKQKNVKLFFDVHGAHISRPFLIDYDFKLSKQHPHDKTVEKSFIEHFNKYFPNDNLSKGFFRMNGSSGNTLTHYVRRNFKIPAMQFELNKSLRKDSEKLEKFIKTIHSMIKHYENYHKTNEIT